MRFDIDPALPDQGATALYPAGWAVQNHSVGYLVNNINSSKDIYYFQHSQDLANTVYTFKQSVTFPANSICIVEPGAMIATTEATANLVFDGLFIAPAAAQCFALLAGSSVKFNGTGMPGVWAEWFGTNYTALYNAFASVSDTPMDIYIGATEFDIGNNTLDINLIDVTIRGMSKNQSKIKVGTGGSVRFGDYDHCRGTWLENLKIYSSGTANKVISTAKTAGGHAAYECGMRKCSVSGGAYSIWLDNLVSFRLEDCRVTNDNSGRYAFYSEGTSYVNGLTIDGTRFLGAVRVGGTRACNVQNSIFEATYGTLLSMVGAKGGTIRGNHFEGDATGLNCLNIDANCYGFDISGNLFDVHDTSTVHILVYGKSISIQGNDFSTIGSQDQITLKTGSEHCYVGPNSDNGGYGHIPEVTDETAGAGHHFIWGQHITPKHVPAADWMHPSNTITNTIGIPIWEAADGTDDVYNIWFKLPTDMEYVGGTGFTRIYVRVIYYGAATAADKAVVFRIGTSTLDAGDDPTAALADWQYITESGIVTTLTESDWAIITLATYPSTATQSYLKMRVGRNSTHTSDTYANTINMVGLDVQVRSTSGLGSQML